MEKKKIKNYLIYTVATAVFIAIVYALFSSPKDNSAEAADELKLNNDLPEGESETLPDDKVLAYEDLVRAEEAQLRGLGTDELNIDLSSLNDSAPQSSPDDGRNIGSGEVGDKVSDAVANAKKTAEMLQTNRGSSVSAAPQKQDRDREKEAEQERSRQALEDLRRRNEQAQQAVLQMLQQQGQQQKTAAGSSSDANAADAAAAALAGSVSAIPDDHGDIATTLGRSRERRGGFYGMSRVEVPRNSIKACAYGAQVVGDGQSLRIRLLEPMMASGQLIPAGSILSGTCRITTDRLLVSIQSVECNGVITRVALEVYDNDGLQGLYVPGSLELEAGREVGADIANSVGSAAASQTSMFSQQSAAEQIKADVGRGVVQGTFRFIGKKLQVVKVTVQDKHLLFLMTQKQ